jgi:glycerophosphoryl diester phosphodiesterase
MQAPARSPASTAALAPTLAPASATACPWPRFIAHRGAGRLAPENTLAAFRHGAALGQRGFECDVRLSTNGTPFLLHDDALERCTSGHGPAAALSWAQLSQLDAGSWHSPTFAGEPPASLASVARFCQAGGFWLNLELKPNPGEAARTGQVVAAEVARLWAGRADVPLLSSFQPEALAAAHQTAPALPLALLLEALHQPAQQTVAAHALALGCCAVVVQHRALDAAQIAQLHAAGLQVLAYTVNQVEDAQRLQAAGVDALITDAVDVFRP